MAAGQEKNVELSISRYAIESALKDYHWMINSIKVLRETMSGAGERVVAQYGTESAMPKGQGGTSDPVHQEYLRREKRWNRIYAYEEKVLLIQERTHLICEEREVEVLHWLLEGKSYSWIARHMGLSERHIRRIKDCIVDQMSNMPSLPEKPKI